MLIAANSRVAVCIFNAADFASSGTGSTSDAASDDTDSTSNVTSDSVNDDPSALYMCGQAREVTKQELSNALTVYARREKANDPQAQQFFASQTADFAGDSPLRMYIFTSNEMYILNNSTLWHGKWLDTRSRNIL